MLRGHQPITIEEFNGLWRRGDKDSTPLDHFSDCNNVQFIQSGFKTRDGIDILQLLPNVIRMYEYTKQTTEAVLVLDDQNNIYDSDSITPTTPILTITGMTDFAMVAVAGRAYINPNDGSTGLSSESLYVYMGDGSVARKAAGSKPTSAPAAANGSAGTVEAGYHVFAVAYETNTGFITGIGPGVALNATGALKVNLTSIPVSPNSYVVARRIVATRAIDPNLWTGDLNGYEFFFVDGGRIADNTATTLTVDFYDSELLDSADYLQDLYETIPAGVNLALYRGRLISIAEHDNISLARVSFPGQPEAIDQTNGLILVGGIVKPSGSVVSQSDPLTAVSQCRDVLYLFKATKTFATNDNGDVPSSWEVQTIDNGVGSAVHGILTILDSDGVNIDRLLIANFIGICQFSGMFTFPELTWKIKDFWSDLDRDNFSRIQLVNHTRLQTIFCILTDYTILIADYGNGENHKDIRFAPWSFDIIATGVTILNKETVVISSSGLVT